MKWFNLFMVKVIAVFIYALLCSFVVFIEYDDVGIVDNDEDEADYYMY